MIEIIPRYLIFTDGKLEPGRLWEFCNELTCLRPGLFEARIRPEHLRDLQKEPGVVEIVMEPYLRDPVRVIEEISSGYELVNRDDPILRQKAQPFDIPYYESCDPLEAQEFWYQIGKLVQKMFSVMDANAGRGLAAPQIGVSKRLFVMRTENKTMVCIDPELIWCSEETETLEEGCLSFPGDRVVVARSQRIRVSYYTEDGKKKTHYLNGIAARCFLHEFQHLEGIVMHDLGVPKAG